MWPPISAGMAGRPHPQALDRPLLGVPGSCPAPSQCSLITLGHPQVPGWAVAFRRGPCMSPTFSHPPVPGLGGSVASGPTRPSSRSGHSWWAPDSPAVRRAHSSLAQPAGTTPGPRREAGSAGLHSLGPGWPLFQGDLSPWQLSPESPRSRAWPGVGGRQEAGRST